MIAVAVMLIVLVAVLAAISLVKTRPRAREGQQDSLATAPVPPTERVRIRLSGMDGKIEWLVLQGERMTLGRSSGNDFCYPADNALSRRHLVFAKNARAWTISDLESKNGTFVNGLRLVTAHVLRPGDRIVAGRLKMVCNSSDDAVNRRVLSEEEDRAAPQSAAADGKARS